MFETHQDRQRLPATAEDQLLLEAIGKKRDREAFACLVKRFEGTAFSLARQITGSPELAEEVVQQAMLRIWLKAGSFRSGNVRGWILKIVARESFQFRQKRKRQMTSSRLVPSSQATAQPAGLPTDPEGAEIRAALRSALTGLDPLQARFLALHFGGGLTHEEIAREVGLPRPTVSWHIRRALACLQQQLREKGQVPAVGWIASHLLQEALSTGSPTPPHLLEKILGRLTESRPRLLREPHSPRAQAPSAGFLCKAALAVTGVVVSVLSLEAHLGWTTPALPAAARPDWSAPSPPAAPESPSRAAPMRSWSFDRFEELPEPAAGVWHWERDPGSGRGQLRAETWPGAVLVLPLERPSQNVLVETDFVSQGVEGGTVFAGWSNGQSILKHRAAGLTTKTSKGARIQLRAYFMGQYVISFMGKDLSSIHEYEPPIPGTHIAVNALGRAIQAVHLSSLEEGQTPPELRDPKALLDRLNQPWTEYPGLHFAELPQRPVILDETRPQTLARQLLDPAQAWEAGPAKERVLLAPEDGLARELRCLGTRLPNETGGQEEGVLRIPPQQPAADVILPFETPPGPFVLETSFRPLQAGPLRIGAGWSDGVEQPACRLVIFDLDRQLALREEFSRDPRLRVYGIDRFLVTTTTDGEPLRLTEYRRRSPRLHLTLSNALVTSLAAKTLPESSVPPGILKLLVDCGRSTQNAVYSWRRRLGEQEQVSDRRAMDRPPPPPQEF